MGYEMPKLNIHKDTQIHLDFSQEEFEMRRKKAIKEAGLADDANVNWDQGENDFVDKNGIPLSKIKELYSDNNNEH